MKRAIIILLTFFTIMLALAPITLASEKKSETKNFYQHYMQYIVRVETEYELTSLGIMIMNGGYILTPAETVEDANTIKIKTSSGGRFTAKLIGIDKYHNLALLRVPAFYGKKIQYLTLKEQKIPPQGSKVLIFSEKMNNNILNVVNIIETNARVTIGKDEYYFGMLKTDSGLRFENSGTPVLNEKGDLIGMTMTFEEKSKAFADTTYIVPVNTMIKSANEIKLYGTKRIPFSGITKIVPLTKKFMIEKLHLPNDKCYAIEKIKNNSPANNAGLRKGIGLSKNGSSFGLEGDIIVSIDGYTFDNAKELIYYINSKFLKDIINIQLIRNGLLDKINIPVTLGATYE